MKILFIADVSIQHVIGGAERMLFEQSVRLARRGHAIHILTRRPCDDQRDHLVFQNVTERRYDVDTRSSLTFLRSTLRNARRLFESMQAEGPFDCIHFHQPFSAAGVLRSRHVRGIPKLCSNYSLSFEEFLSRNPPPKSPPAQVIYRLNAFFRKQLERWVLNQCRTIVVLSQFSQQRLLDAHGILAHKTTLIPGGVDTDKFQPAPDKLAIRRRLQIPTDRVVLFTVRNLVPRMGLENLIRAMQEVSRRAPDVILVLGGNGPLAGALKDLAHCEGIANRVRFAGFIPEEQLPGYYQMADLFVLPTRELEGFGLVTLESLASGVPVAGTPVGGTKEVLGRFDPGFIFKDSTPASMAALIMDCYLQIKKHPQHWKETSVRCRRFVEENYSWEAGIDALENLYQSLTRHRGSSDGQHSCPSEERGRPAAA
jgi:glycosyltransferase involved in cell wall biosynthesis